MQIHKQKQIIHTPAHFFNETCNAGSLDFGSGIPRTIENQRSTTDGVLIERRNFHVRIADTQCRQNQVSELIHRMYSWRGYQLGISASRCNPGRITLQACSGNETLGTLTLNADSENGLLADDLYRREVDTLRRRGATVCELTGLAVSARLGSNELLASLFHLLHILGRRLHRATDAVIEVNPRHSAYYQRLLGFNQIGERKLCGRVDAPAVLLHIEADFIEEQIARHAGDRKKKGHSLYPYFFDRLETERLSRRLTEMHGLLPGLPPRHS